MAVILESKRPQARLIAGSLIQTGKEVPGSLPALTMICPLNERLWPPWSILAVRLDKGGGLRLGPHAVHGRCAGSCIPSPGECGSEVGAERSPGWNQVFHLGRINPCQAACRGRPQGHGLVDHGHPDLVTHSDARWPDPGKDRAARGPRARQKLCPRSACGLRGDFSAWERRIRSRVPPSSRTLECQVTSSSTPLHCNRSATQVGGRSIDNSELEPASQVP